MTITRRTEMFSESYVQMGKFTGCDGRVFSELTNFELAHTEPTRDTNVLEQTFKVIAL